METAHKNKTVLPRTSDTPREQETADRRSGLKINPTKIAETNDIIGGPGGRK